MKKLITALVLSLFAFNVYAEWSLNNDESTVSFVSVKKSKVGEVHTFGNLSGSLNKNGKARVVIGLASVETMIPIRNERMKTMLFNVANFPEAVITTDVDLQAAKKMKAGEAMVQKTSLSVSLHGQVQSIEATMQVVKLTGNKILVSTIKPVIVNAAKFKLAAGVDKLREVAKLPSISAAVPVTANLVFEK